MIKCFNSPVDSMMFKFSPNQLPVTVFMVRDAWAKTLMEPDLIGVEAA